MLVEYEITSREYIFNMEKSLFRHLFLCKKQKKQNEKKRTTLSVVVNIKWQKRFIIKNHYLASLRMLFMVIILRQQLWLTLSQHGKGYGMMAWDASACNIIMLYSITKQKKRNNNLLFVCPSVWTFVPLHIRVNVSVYG